MAAGRWLQNQLLQQLGRRQSSLFRESNWALAPPSSRVLSGFEFFRQGIHAQSVPANQVDADAEKNDACDPTPDTNDLEIHPPPEPDSSSAIKYTVTSDLKISPRHDLALIFTCKVCETRSMKMVCRESYEKGVVVVRCDGCQNLHLIADRLGWFGEPGSIEELLASRGEEVKKGSVDSLNLTLEDLAGKKLSSA